jgi:hypothetical protein
MTGDELLKLEERLDRIAQIAVNAEYDREFAALKKRIQHGLMKEFMTK